MNTDVYKRLAELLDNIPNGFPATESGVEIRLLKKIFDMEEAALASELRLSVKPVEEIAERAGLTPRKARALLERMEEKGQIRRKKGKNGLRYGLMPFIVGIYEDQLPRMDEEFASLFEQYYQERFNRVFEFKPAVHRVIPIDAAIPVEIAIFPYEKASELVERSRSWGVRDCICRVQQRLVGNGCDHVIENCLMISQSENAYKDSRISKPIDKKRALEILRESADAGLIHSAANQREGVAYICNCCTCCCGIIRGLTEFGMPAALAVSAFRASVSQEACIGCGTCIEGCRFGALSLPGNTAAVNAGRCVGCGICVPSCPHGALSLVRKPRSEVPRLPANIKEWMLRRALKRRINIKKIL